MKRWSPDAAYNARPWIMMAVGVVVCAGSTAWSVYAGDWGVWRGVICALGGGWVICGGVILLQRQQYRARSKWRRTMSR
jgi:hypothetical protein